MKTLSIEHRGQPVRNLFHSSGGDRGAALLLPGAYYSSQAPGLYFLREALLSRGVDVLAIDYRYFLAGEALSATTRAEAAGEAEAAWRRLASDHARTSPRGRLFIAGKSLGSVLALDLALRHAQQPPVELILLTPLEERLAAMLEQAAQRAGRGAREGREQAEGAPALECLFAVRCGADDARDEAAWARIVPHFRRVHETALERATHGMDSLDGPLASLQALMRMCRDIEDFFGRD